MRATAATKKNPSVFNLRSSYERQLSECQKSSKHTSINTHIHWKLIIKIKVKIYSPRPDCENCDASVRARDEPCSRGWLFVSVCARCEFFPPPAEPPPLLPDPPDECK